MEFGKLRKIIREEVSKVLEANRMKEVAIQPEEIGPFLDVLRWGGKSEGIPQRVVSKLENNEYSNQPVRVEVKEPKASSIASLIHDYIHEYSFANLSREEQEKLENVGIKFDWMRF